MSSRMDERMVYVDLTRCTGCGACVEVCPTGAIRLVKGGTGSSAEIDEAKCQACGACVEVCPAEAIVLEAEPTIEGELVQVKATPVLVEPPSREVRPVRPVPKVLMWLGAALVFAGREIVPRVAETLLDAWDRRASRPAPSPGELTPGSTAQQSMTDLPRGGGRRHRRRKRGH